MTDEKLIEDMARAIGDTLFGYVHPTDTPNIWSQSVSAARATLAIARPAIREEALRDAAEVCQDHHFALQARAAILALLAPAKCSTPPAPPQPDDAAQLRAERLAELEETARTYGGLSIGLSTALSLIAAARERDALRVMLVQAGEAMRGAAQTLRSVPVDSGVGSIAWKDAVELETALTAIRRAACTGSPAHD